MTDKTLTDTEMMIFAISFQTRREKLRANVSIKEDEKVLMCFENAVNDAISIRQNTRYLQEELSRFQSNEIEKEVLRKIIGLPPEG